MGGSTALIALVGYLLCLLILINYAWVWSVG